MKKVYKASYKTDFIYADGYVVQNEDNTFEGVFIYDYAYIYEYNGESVFFLKTQNPDPYYDLFTNCEVRQYEFSTLPIKVLHPNTSYFFYPGGFSMDNLDETPGICLDVKDELFNILEINEVLSSINTIRD